MTDIAPTEANVLYLRPHRSPNGRALNVGLTGGIGSGKSTVAKYWAQMGATVVDADHLARSVLAPDSVGFAALVDHFGARVLNEDGTLDRQSLAEIVFADPNERAALEGITHPLIAAAKQTMFAALRPGQVGVYDVPLLAEKQMAEDFDVVVVVEAPYAARLERLAERGIPRAEGTIRIAAQATDAQRRQVAHVLVDNSGSLAQLRRSAQEVGERILGLPPAPRSVRS